MIMIIYDWAAMIRARQAPARSGVLGLLDHATDGRGRLERTIGGVLGAGLGLLWLGWALGRSKAREDGVGA